MSAEYSPTAPDVTIKWRRDEAPYIEVRHGGKLLLAGWVHPTPDGPLAKIMVSPNPAFEFYDGLPEDSLDETQP